MLREYRDELPIHLVRNHPRNVREDLGDLTELVASIREVGILEPLVVAPDPLEPGYFHAIAGNRRTAAGKVAGLTVVPAVIRTGLTDEQVYQAMLIENLHRVDLGPMEEARALKGLKDSGLTLLEIARKIGKSDAFVHDRIVLNDLPPELAQKVINKHMRVTEATRLAKLLNGRSPGTVDRGWDQPHFAKSHPLWPFAHARCNGLEHKLRRRISGACGSCWEQVIREDQGAAPAAELAADPLDLPDALALLNLFAGCHLNVQTATPLRIRKAIERATERVRDDMEAWQRRQERDRPSLSDLQDEAVTGRVRHAGFTEDEEPASVAG